MGQQATYTPPPVKGYRSLTQAEVDLMNKGKELGQQMQSYVDEVAAHLSLQYAGCIVGENEEPPNEILAELARVAKAEPQRWLSIGRTDLQRGLMATIRAIAQPGTF